MSKFVLILNHLVRPFIQESLSSSELYTIPSSGRPTGGIVAGLLQVCTYVGVCVYVCGCECVCVRT